MALCMAEFSNLGLNHGAMEAELRIFVKEYRRNK
jgi:hypothetical protein